MPRPYVKMGLPGVAQDRFPYAAREAARNQGLYDAEILIWRHTRVSSAGATSNTYAPDAEPVRGRVDPTSSNTAGGLRGGAIQDESSEHLVSFEDGQDISTEDQLEFEGKRWIITSLRDRTDELIVRVEVRTVH